MKKPGDQQKAVPMSMAELTADMGRRIKVKDRRYENFYNFKPFDKYANPDPHYGFFSSAKPVKFIAGSNRSGKTYHALIETVMIYTGIIPPALEKLYAHADELLDISVGPNRRPRHVRIIVQSHNHFADTIKPLLTGDKGFLPEAWSNWNAQTHMFEGPDGSFLEIMPIDPREKDQQKTANTLRGADLDHTQIDEISSPAAYTESRVRSSAKQDGPKTVTLSFCPQEGFDCWTHTDLYQNVFRFTPSADIRLAADKCHPEIFGLVVSMKDSPLISAAEYERQKRAYKPWEVAFRVDGRYSNRTSNPYFNVELLLKWEEEERYSPGRPYLVHEKEADPEKGIFKGEMVEVSENDVALGGCYDAKKHPVWRVWHVPVEGRKYLLSADIAEGNPDSDPHSMTVWDCTDKHLPFAAATLHMRLIKPGDMAVQACCMANCYGNCLVVPEANNTGGGMFIDRARHYVNLYQRLASRDRDMEMDQAKLGWFTSKHTKLPMLESAYRMMMRMASKQVEDIDNDGLLVTRTFCPFRSRTRLHELIGYEERVEHDKNGVAKIDWGARAGGHDDTVMEMAIAWRVIDHEYDKISACKKSHPSAKLRKNLHNEQLGLDKANTQRAFSGMPKQQSLKSRARQLRIFR